MSDGEARPSERIRGRKRGSGPLQSGNVLYAPWPGVGAVVPDKASGSQGNSLTCNLSANQQGLCPVKLSLHLLIGGRGILSSNAQRRGEK